MEVELERFDPAAQGGRIVYEHLHRYALCREFVAGRRVLDLACGTGYGTSILGTAAAEVTGVDISASAVREARKLYAGENVKFVVGDCFDIPFDDGCFDVVVANEMIEHVENHSALLAEIRRVLSDKGLLLVSTPNKPVYNRYKAPNAFHVAEMDVPSFSKLLTQRFRNVRIIGTRMALLSVGYALDKDADRTPGNLDAARIHLATGSDPGHPVIETGELNLADPEYVLAMCSDAELEEPALSSSVFFDERNDLWREHEKIMAWASGLHEEDEVLREDVARTRELLEDARARAAQTEADKAEIAKRFDEFNTQQSNLTTALESERQALKRESEAVRREGAKRLATLAELLGHMGSQEVAHDEAAIVSSLFRINEALVSERLLRGQADERNRQLESSLTAQQDEMAFARSERERLAAELAAKEEKWSVARQALEAEVRLAAERQAEHQRQADAERERLAADIAAGLEDLEVERRTRAELEAAQEAVAQRLEDDAAKLAALQNELDHLRDQSLLAAATFKTREEELTAALSAERRARLLAEAQKASKAASKTEAVGARTAQAGFERADRAGEALGQLHRHTTANVAAGKELVAGKIAALPQQPPLPWHMRLRGKSPLLPTSIFAQEWLDRQLPGHGALSFRAYLADSSKHGLSPHPLFDNGWYLRTYPDVAQSGMAPLVHYVLYGWRESRDPHPLFPNDWYLAQNPDVAASGEMTPLDHYLLHGWKEGRRPNPLFDPRAYLERYSDVESGEYDPLSHFIAYGEAEGREVSLDGWSKDLPDLATQGGALRVMERLLREMPPPPAVPDRAAPASPASLPWPPQPLDNFWPAQTMREMIQERYGEPLLGRIWFLLSIMNRWQDRQEDFATSDDCRDLLARLRERANADPSADKGVPSASIVIPVYNNILDSLLCLASLLELDERHDFEVIVADDGSTDATPALVTMIGGKVRYVRQPQNMGFLGNCNAAAAHARGRNIVFLNNDTLVLTGWLDGLIDPIESLPNVGMVGSKLINWDGTLQEAGGIFWRDGSAWNFGRNQDLQAPEFNYLKDVDYCSGASIAVPAQIWRQLDGFDPAYSPAYCEDSDLAFRLREAGYRTIYSPASEVVHHEGRSHGRDVSSGIKAYQVVNQQRLVERWRHVLDSDHFPNAQNVLRARDRSFAKKHVLVIDHYVPQWDRDAGSRTIYDFIQSLIDARHMVTFWPDNLWRDPDYTPRLQALGVEVIFGPRYRGGFEQFLIDRRELYDMVLLSRPHVAAEYIAAVERSSDARIVYYGHDLHFERMMAERRLAGRPPEDDEVRVMKAQEIDICNRSSIVLYPSAEEARLIAQLVRPGVEAHAIAAYRYLPDEVAQSRQDILARTDHGSGLHLLFVGGFGHPPNIDSATWFSNSVMPLVRARNPAVRLSIVGSRPTPEILALTQPGIDVLGFVSDERLRELYREADVAVAPLRYGAGVKGKVIEAMARGLPVVTTAIGAQGIAGASELLFKGETPEELAEQVLLAAEPTAARERALRALDYVESHYSTQAMIQILEMGLRPAE